MEIAAAQVKTRLFGQCDELPAEVVVVDQADGAEGDRNAFGDRVRVIATPSVGLSNARNLGARAARSEVLVFLDDDILVEPAWLRALVDALVVAGPDAVVTGRVQAGEPEQPHAFTPATALGDERVSYRGRLRRDVLAGGSMALFRSLFEEVGGFDPRLGAGARFPAAEDNDLGLRLLERGCTIVYVPEAVAVHRAWRGRGDSLRLRWRYGRGKGGFYGKHASLRDRHMLARAARDVGRRLLALPLNAVTSRGRAAADIAYSAGVIGGMVEWLVCERAVRGR